MCAAWFRVRVHADVGRSRYAEETAAL